MSRIHEALKRAEMERASAPPASAPGVRFDEHGTASLGAEVESVNSQIATGVAPQPTVSSPAPARALQFSDVLAHCSQKVWRPDPRENVFLDPERSLSSAEQFRTLRSRLYQLRGDQQLRTLMVTSAVAGEGKTFVTSNLAHSIVRQHERRVLLIDGDLRCSRLHLPLGAPNVRGLCDYLRGDADLLSVIQHGTEGNLCLIPAGKVAPNPSELLSNARMKVLLERLVPAFDWILIDSPPCLPVADANILADLCDGVLLVVKARSTPSAVVEKAGRELQGRNVVGVVMNRVEESAFGYKSYYSAGYPDSLTGGVSREK